MIDRSENAIRYSSKGFEADYTYQGNDLGAIWSPEATTFRLWAPEAESCSVIAYQTGDIKNNDLLFKKEMTPEEKGTWTLTIPQNLNGVYYTYEVERQGIKVEACDPYAKTVGVNGNRAMVIDMASCNPSGWEQDTNPNANLTINDAIIYEVHIRDFSSSISSGMTNKGEFLAFTEHGTTNAFGQATGIDYLKDLGITHVHFLPMFDYGSIEESEKGEAYNWGYDPQNYNVPEGSYSSNAFDGFTRVREMKQMIQSLHENGISVVMDVVYNHVYDAKHFCFNQIVPGYFSRVDQNGVYSNGSYCGNDTASERSMVHNYIVQSVLYWMEEYHIDGFRFDLVGLLDIDVINELVSKVKSIRKDVIFYGEGWDMATNMTKEGYKRAIQMNAQLTPDFAYFNDSIRDILKGNYSKEVELGYVNGAKGRVEALKANIMGLPYWSPAPAQTVQYTSCHDDYGIFDRLRVACPNTDINTIAKYNCLAAAVVLLSEGVPFIHAGEEMLRTKQDQEGKFISNSYNASDHVNSIKWNDLNDALHAKVREYYKGLIAFRKEHPALRLQTAEEVRNVFKFIGNLEGEVIAYEIHLKAVKKEEAEQILVIFNPEKKEVTVPLPEGKWNVYIKGDTAGTKVMETIEKEAMVSAISTMVFVQ